MNLEFLNAVHTLQRSKALKRNFRCSSYKLQKFRSVRLVKRSEGSPEPLNLLRLKTKQIACY